MPSINIPAFTGLNTKLEPHLLKPGELKTAINVTVESGALRPLTGPGSTGLSVAAGTVRIYKFNGAWETASAEAWWAEDNNELYLADGGTPSKMNTSGGTARLGIAPPSGTPSIASGFIFDHGPVVDPIKVAITFVSDTWGGESAPLLSEISFSPRHLAITVQTSGTVAYNADAIAFNDIYSKASSFREQDGYVYVSSTGEIFHYQRRVQYGSTLAFEGCTRGALGTVARDIAAAVDLDAYGCKKATINGVPTSADAQVTGRKIYVLSAGEYRLANTTSDNTTTTIEQVPAQGADLTAGLILTSDDNDVPPNLTGLCGPLNGLMFGWLGNSIYWTKTGNYDAWPALQTYAYPTAVQTCVVFGGVLVALTLDGVYTVSGSDPEGLAFFKGHAGYGCIAPRSAVATEHGVLYLSKDGLVLFDGLRARLISDDKLATKTWGGLVTSRAAYHDGRYYLFHDGNAYYSAGCVIGDFRGGEPIWTMASVTADDAHYSTEDGTLYLLSGTAIQEWGTGSTLSMSAATGSLFHPSNPGFVLPYLGRFNVLGTVTCAIYLSGSVLSATLTLTDTGYTLRKRIPPKRGDYLHLVFTGYGVVETAEIEIQ